jgi:hypothetical protein
MDRRLTFAALLLVPAASLAGTSAKPAHLALAERMVAEVKPANNMYANGPFTVTWAGVNGRTLTYNKSDCTTFVTALLKTGYGFTARQFEDWFGKSSPSITLYYDAALANTGLRGFKQIDELRPGDLLISKFAPDTGGAAGHMLIADAIPEFKTTKGAQKVYDVTIIDCTGSPHSDDTRARPQSGAGRGVIRLYTDLSGKLVTWGWSTVAKPYDAAARPMTFAKVPPSRTATASR